MKESLRSVSKKFEIHSLEDLNEMFSIFLNYCRKRKNKGLPFQSLNIVSKKYRKPKSSKQHQTYWRCIGELKKAFLGAGSVYNDDQLHNFVKIASGFTEVIEGKMIPRSIADSSEDATSKELNFLISWICQFAVEKLDYFIDVREKLDI